MPLLERLSGESARREPTGVTFACRRGKFRAAKCKHVNTASPKSPHMLKTSARKRQRSTIRKLTVAREWRSHCIAFLGLIGDSASAIFHESLGSVGDLTISHFIGRFPLQQISGSLLSSQELPVPFWQGQGLAHSGRLTHPPGGPIRRVAFWEARNFPLHLSPLPPSVRKHAAGKLSTSHLPRFITDSNGHQVYRFLPLTDSMVLIGTIVQ
jgi:hypothetical protein